MMFTRHCNSSEVAAVIRGRGYMKTVGFRERYCAVTDRKKCIMLVSGILNYSSIIRVSRRNNTVS